MRCKFRAIVRSEDFNMCGKLVETSLWKSLKQWKTSVFYFNKYIHVTLEKSSINVTKYLKPSIEIEQGPHTSEWISSKTWETLDTDNLNGSLLDLE